MGIILLFIIAQFFPALYHAVWYVLYVLMAFVLIDILLLFGSNKKVIGSRTSSEKLSNGDENEIHIALNNQFTFPVRLKIIDEIPFQFQQRNFEVKRTLKAQAKDDYYKIYNELEKRKNSNSNNMGNETIIQNVLLVFNELQSNLLGHNPERISWKTVQIQHILNQLLQLFPFTEKYRKF